MTAVALGGEERIADYRTLVLSERPLLDVRAPVEFQRGALPGAVNLPLMNDEERHRVGLRYKELGQEAAIELGAELIGDKERERRTAAWLHFAEQHPDGALYCFRGGLRSRIAHRWLSDAGCDFPVIDGGYKAMRSWLLGELERLCRTSEFVLIGGRTGVGKTLLLQHIGRSIDLEGLARHRGSSFGNRPGGQPGNIDFENALTVALLKCEAEAVRAPIYLEDEARMIGRVCLPEALRDAMARSPAIVLEASLATRIENCLEDYVVSLLDDYRASNEQGFEAYARHHRDSLDRIRRRLGGANHAEASRRLETALDAHRHDNDLSAYRPFIEWILERYYDPMYDYQLSQKARRVLFRGNAAEILARTQS